MARAGGQAAVTRYQHGRGAIWLANRPQFLTNRLLRRADNAILLCRISEAMLAEGDGKLAFDEFFHGIREHPGLAELLLAPPTVWVTLQFLLLAGLFLWRNVPRFGSVQAAHVARRRSKDEYLDALASLMERKHAYADAYAAIRADLVQEMERNLGLPAGTEIEVLARQAEVRRLVRRETLLPLSTTPASEESLGAAQFSTALNQLETIRHEFFDRGQHR
jgi:hypothetical protein